MIVIREGCHRREWSPVAADMSLAGFHERWDGIVGTEAAVLRHRAYRARVMAFYSAIAVTGCTIVSGATKSSPAVHWLFLALAVAAGAFIFVWIAVWRHQLSRSCLPASRFLGCEITLRNFPPFKRDLFLKWCERNNVPPPSAVPSP